MVAVALLWDRWPWYGRAMSLIPPPLPRLSSLPEVSLVTWNPVSKCIHRANKLIEAQGVQFECPCGEGHMICIWFHTPPVLPPASSDSPPNEKRWEHGGTSLEDLSLWPSILLPCWHGFIENGAVKSV
jgi:hypothetical protein